MTSRIPASTLSAGADDALAPLLEECARVLEWLDRLAACSGEVPDHIAARVCSGYEQRLEQALEEMRPFADAARAQEGAVREAAATAAAVRSEASDALDEAKLRHLAGELSDDEWAEREPRLAAEFERAGEECNALDRAVDQLGTLLESLQHASGQDAPAGEVAPPPAAEEAASPEIPTAPIFQLVDDADLVEDATSVDDAIIEEAATAEDDHLDTIFAEWDDAPEAQPAEELPWLELIEEENGAAGGHADDAELFTAPAAVPATPAPAAPPSTLTFAPAPAVVAAAAEPEEEDDGLAFLAELDRVLGTTPSGDNDSAVAVAPAATELDVQTLTCAACQNDNPPQSWYCENCGSELN